MYLAFRVMAVVPVKIFLQHEENVYPRTHKENLGKILYAPHGFGDYMAKGSAYQARRRQFDQEMMTFFSRLSLIISAMAPIRTMALTYAACDEANNNFMFKLYHLFRRVHSKITENAIFFIPVDDKVRVFSGQKSAC